MCVQCASPTAPGIVVLDVVFGHAGNQGRAETDGTTVTPIVHIYSLECVKDHKINSGCSGVRCRTKYVSLSSFTDSQLLSGQ